MLKRSYTEKLVQWYIFNDGKNSKGQHLLGKLKYHVYTVTVCHLRFNKFYWKGSKDPTLNRLHGHARLMVYFKGINSPKIMKLEFPVNLYILIALLLCPF